MSNNIINVATLGFPWATKDPFLFCAYHKDQYPAGNAEMGVDSASLRGRQIGQDFTLRDGWRMYHGTTIPGFPYHPHKGFETITINKEGYVDHCDSLGAAGRFGGGDVQWMTAGKGILHSEMFPLLNRDKDNPLEIFQVWLNLPSYKKLVDPHFKMLWKEMIPVINEKDPEGKQITIDVIAGKYKNTDSPESTPDSWAADPTNGITILTVKIEAGGTWTLPAAASADMDTTLYFYRGKDIKISNQQINHSHLIEVNPSEDIIIENGNETAFFLVLRGKPIEEPVAQHGPFVMNNDQEIREAFSEYQRTQFGGWPWDKQEKVHDRNRGRFALHADGKEEIKD